MPPAGQCPVTIAPWQAEPYRLWSLYEMQQFFGAAFALVISNLEQAIATFATADDAAHARRHASAKVKELAEECAPLPLSVSFKKQVERFLLRVEQAEMRRDVLMMNLK